MAIAEQGVRSEAQSVDLDRKPPLSFREILLRNRPKSLEAAFGVALPAAKESSSLAHFGLRMPAKSTLRALPESPSGEFRKRVSWKFGE